VLRARRVERVERIGELLGDEILVDSIRENPRHTACSHTGCESAADGQRGPEVGEGGAALGGGGVGPDGGGGEAGGLEGAGHEAGVVDGDAEAEGAHGGGVGVRFARQTRRRAPQGTNRQVARQTSKPPRPVA